MAIQIDVKTMEDLARFASKNALISDLLDLGNDVVAFDLIDEHYHSLQASLVEEFAPLIDKLVRAGLISVCIDGDGEKFAGFVGGRATGVYANGNINIHSSRIDSAMDQPFQVLVF